MGKKITQSARKLQMAVEECERFLYSKRGIGFSKKQVPFVECYFELCGQRKIRSLNKSYRNKDKKTDVLSFQMMEGIRHSITDCVGPQALGDILVCHEVATAQAKKFGISFTDELIHLIIHGFLHLCGYDHEVSEEEEKIMEKLEKSLLNNIHKKLRA